MRWLIDGWEIDPLDRTAKRNGVVARLSPRAIRFLGAMREAKGATVSRAKLMDQVWPGVFVGDESLTQVVSELRSKLQSKDVIGTVNRGGYRLTVPIECHGEREFGSSQGVVTSLSIDSYTLCIEAVECFARAHEGAERTAVDLAAQAVAIAPNYADARALHAALLLKRHMIWSEGTTLAEKALDEVEVALKLDKDHALAQLIGAAASLMTGVPGYGVPNLERALALASSDPSLHSDASVLLLFLGKAKGSATLALRSAQLDRQRFGDQMNAARLLRRTDPAWAHALAESALKKAQEELSVDPNSVPALYSLGPLLAQVGDKHAARSALEGVAHHDSPLEFFRAIGFALIGDVSSALERIDFVASRGWRMGPVLDHDDCFRSMMNDRRFQSLRGELMAA